MFNWLKIFWLFILKLEKLYFGGLGLCFGKFGLFLICEIIFGKSVFSFFVLLMGWIFILLIYDLIDGGGEFL